MIREIDKRKEKGENPDELEKARKLTENEPRKKSEIDSLILGGKERKGVYTRGMRREEAGKYFAP